LYLHTFSVLVPGGVPGLGKHYDLAVFKRLEDLVIEEICGRLAARDVK
jgi:hypothetical protein